MLGMPSHSVSVHTAEPPKRMIVTNLLLQCMLAACRKEMSLPPFSTNSCAKLHCSIRLVKAGLIVVDYNFDLFP